MAAFLDTVKFSVQDPTKSPPQENPVSGPSPYWDKYQEGPSYIKPEDRQKPLKSSGELDKKYSTFAEELTPRLGTTYKKEVRITDLLKDDNLLRDLAIQIAQRGLVVFKEQDDLTVEQQKEFIQKLGLLSGKPKNNGLHKHPLSTASGILGEDGLIDLEVSFITNRGKKQFNTDVNRPSAFSWHSDITFEPAGPDFSSLRIVEKPSTGGDTFWANGYALYEKLSPSFRAYLETLTGTYTQPRFNELSGELNIKLWTEVRGATENVGEELIAVHPLIRTNPVTGWKSVFALGQHFSKVNEVNSIESTLIKQHIWNTLVQSHDIQIRHKWDTFDIAIWDNRSTYHAINSDIHTLDSKVFRTGIRTVGIAERPYLDPNSITQSEGLQKLAEEETKEETKEEKKEEETK